MQLERREAIELVLSSRASVLSQVATRLSSFDRKTSEPKKSYKRSGALNLKHREVKSCDEKKYRSYKTYISFRHNSSLHGVPKSGTPDLL